MSSRPLPLTVSLILSAALAAGCGGSGSDRCSGFEQPSHAVPTSCDALDVANPQAFASCLVGSGTAGQWTVDPDGLPAYQFNVDHRCDEAAAQFDSAGERAPDPVHVVGNGRGLIALAHASGAVELYSQDRGPKFLNKLDLSPGGDQQPQVAGGFNYLVIDGKVHSTRYDDLPLGEATAQQTRRFGIGYYETETTIGDITIRRRLIAPDTNARAVVAEITISNAGTAYEQVGVVEMWDANVAPIAPTTKAMAAGDRSAARRSAQAGYSHTVSYNPSERAIVLSTLSATGAGLDRLAASEVDHHVDPIFLAVADDGAPPDSVFLEESELYSGSSRKPPADANKTRAAEERSVEVSGERQRGLLAMRLDLSVPNGGSVTRRFAFGYLPGETQLGSALDELRSNSGELASESIEAWKQKLAYVAVPALADAAALQREMAWASYNLQAQAAYDEIRGLRVLGRGGAYRYVHGLDTAPGDLAMIADSIALVDAELARDSLLFAMTLQHGASSATPGRFAYSGAGVGFAADPEDGDLKTDAYFSVPSSLGHYIALTRDVSVLDRELDFYPAGGDTRPVREHIAEILRFATDELGVGARGLAVIGSGDYSDGVLDIATEPATPLGSSSSVNAGLALMGIDVLADVIATGNDDVAPDEELAGSLLELFNGQAQALGEQAFNGKYFERGFVDNGDPLAPTLIHLWPQALAASGRLLDEASLAALVDQVTSHLQTPAGAIGARDVEATDAPMASAIWPLANAWWTDAVAKLSPDKAWDTLLANTMTARATAYPDHWYLVWSSPDGFYGPDHDRAGEAAAQRFVDLADFPGLGTHGFVAGFRALTALLGVTGRVDGWLIEPHFPDETFAVLLPQFELSGTPDTIAGRIRSSGDDVMRMEVALASGMKASAIRVVGKFDVAIDFARGTDTVTFDLPVRANDWAEFRIDAL